MEQFFKRRDVLRRYQISGTKLYKEVKAGRFPAPDRIGENTVRWRGSAQTNIGSGAIGTNAAHHALIDDDNRRAERAISKPAVLVNAASAFFNGPAEAFGARLQWP